MRQPVDVLAVMVTYNSADVLSGLITSLPTGLAGLSWHLVVVDNASTDDSVDLAMGICPDCTIVTTGRNAGYAAGVNAGVAAGDQYRSILILNPDVRLEPNCGMRLWKALARPGIGIAVPRLADGSGELHFSLRREPTLLRKFGDLMVGAARAGRWPIVGEIVTDRRIYEGDVRVVDWAEGSTQLISRACWEACGRWDESYFLYSEETEFGLRARDRGFETLYVPSAQATHLKGASETSEALWPLLVANQVRLYSSRNGPLRGALFWLLTTLREASRAILGRKVSWAALRVLTSPARMRQPRSAEWLASAAEKHPTG